MSFENPTGATGAEGRKGGPKNYLDLMTNTPYKALSDIELIRKGDGATYTIPSGTVFYLFPDMGGGKGVRIDFSSNANDPRTVYIDPSCKGLETLGVERA